MHAEQHIWITCIVRRTHNPLVISGFQFKKFYSLCQLLAILYQVDQLPDPINAVLICTPRLSENKQKSESALCCLLQQCFTRRLEGRNRGRKRWQSYSEPFHLMANHSHLVWEHCCDRDKIPRWTPPPFYLFPFSLYSQYQCLNLSWGGGARHESERREWISLTLIDTRPALLSWYLVGVTVSQSTVSGSYWSLGSACFHCVLALQCVTYCDLP